MERARRKGLTENGQNPRILASQDSNDATEEAMGHG
jgi:hypothetical protein